MTEYQNVLFERQGPVAVLTLNRPDSLNAINFAMKDEIMSALTGLNEDLDCRVLVVTGAGRGFCAGLDMKDPDVIGDMSRYTPKFAYERQKSYSDFISLMRRVPQPIVAAVNGASHGAGLSIAMAADVRLASPAAHFCAAYINIGVGGADMGSSWLLTRLVGLGNASRYLLTGDRLGAEEAHRIGLVQHVVAADALMAEAVKLAQTMASKSPLGLRLTKEALDRNAGAASLEDALRLEDRNQALCIAQMASASKDG